MNKTFTINWVIKDARLYNKLSFFRYRRVAEFSFFREKVFSELVALSERYGEVEKNE